MSSPMKAVLDVLALLGEIEWARCVGGTDPLRPPFVAWRFKKTDERAEAMISHAVLSYSGATEWGIKKDERNWVIEPTSFAGCAAKFRVDVDALQSFGRDFPSQTRAALQDAPRLAEHLRRTLIPN